MKGPSSAEHLISSVKTLCKTVKSGKGVCKMENVCVVCVSVYPCAFVCVCVRVCRELFSQPRTAFPSRL